MEEEKSIKRTFANFHWCIDYENYEWIMIVVELINGVPVSSYVVPMTKPFLKCTIYPYIRN
jgi:hypothetical protein